jgi:hypothetical protein
MYGYQEYFNLTPSQVLEKISEAQIFGFILQQEIIIGKRVYRSPFRIDDDPGCRIVPYGGKLWFEDFASGHPPRDCFNMVRDFYGVNHQESIQIVCKHFLLSSDLSEYTPVPIAKYEDSPRAKTQIPYQTRNWEKRDQTYWSKYLITKQQLEEDGVKPLRNYGIVNRDGKLDLFSPYDITYLYNFNPRYKIYRPENSNSDYRFITNCDQNDIGNLSKISIFGEDLTIGKSYKDHRVLKNALETNNVIWTQNEVVIPDDEILIDLSVRFKKINILYDNDKQGKEGGTKLEQAFLRVNPEANINKVFLPLRGKYSHKDPAQFVNKEGMKELKEVLKRLRVYGTRTRGNSSQCPFILE